MLTSMSSKVFVKSFNVKVTFGVDVVKYVKILVSSISLYAFEIWSVVVTLLLNSAYPVWSYAISERGSNGIKEFSKYT